MRSLEKKRTLKKNTKLRIISAFALISLFSLAIFLGKQSLLIFFLIFSCLIVDEIVHNFIETGRASKTYIFSQLLFIAPFVYLHFVSPTQEALFYVRLLAHALNLFLLLYLLSENRLKGFLKNCLKKAPFLIGLFVLIPVLTFSSVVYFEKWEILLFFAIVLNFSVDVFAWFFGRKMGKHKLWVEVSPSKTVEGTIGGVLCSVILASLFSYYFLNSLNSVIVIGLFVLACCAQIGDLIQSKLKRQFDLKDSSGLIPGHGGVYDRVDSLLFVGPFYIFFLVCFSHYLKI